MVINNCPAAAKDLFVCCLQSGDREPIIVRTNRRFIGCASQSKQVWLRGLGWRIGGWGAWRCICVWWWYVIVPKCIVYIIVYVIIFLAIVSQSIIYILIIFILIILESIIVARQG
jgi:hypothetical protein